MMHRTTFVTPREEGGINLVYDPENDGIRYQVFIHNRFPYREMDRWEFASFAEARGFAARHFTDGWDMLQWDQKVKRPCEEGGFECGSGTCATCSSLKGDGKAETVDGASGCGACGHG